MAGSQIDPFDLSIINQKDCPRNLTAGYNIKINDDTISAKAAAGVIRKAGEKLGIVLFLFVPNWLTKTNKDWTKLTKTDQN